MSPQPARRDPSASAIVALVGDSDIAYWPQHLLPQVRDTTIVQSGHSGATLAQVLPYLMAVLEDCDNGNVCNVPVIVIFCAGENDIGSQVSLDSTLEAVEKLFDMLFADESRQRFLIFLGPKFEPWLVDDHASRKAYARMSRAFHRACHKRQQERIHYVDCLTMFCGATADLPGAVLGGKAIPDSKYFSQDQLHLSATGYEVWKKVVEAKVQEIMKN